MSVAAFIISAEDEEESNIDKESNSSKDKHHSAIDILHCTIPVSGDSLESFDN